MSSSGLSKVLEAAGAKRTLGRQLEAGSLYLPPKGDKFWHPRGDYPVDVAVRDSIVSEGFREDEPVKVWQQVAAGGEKTLDNRVLKKGDALFVVGDGSQRSIAAFAAQKILRANGAIGPRDPLMVPVVFFVGSEKDFFLMRQEADSKPLKKPHSPEVVAHNYVAAAKWGATPAELKIRAPRHYEDRTVEALLRWKELPAKVAVIIDGGFLRWADIPGKIKKTLSQDDWKDKEVSVNLLSVLLDQAPRDEMLDALVGLVLANRRKVATATRWMNEQRHAEAVVAERVAAAAPATTEASAKASPPTPPSATTSSRKGAPPAVRGEVQVTHSAEKAALDAARAELPVPVRKPHPKASLRLLHDLAKKAEQPDLTSKVEQLTRAEVIGIFAAGVQWSLAQDIQRVPKLPVEVLTAVVQAATPGSRRKAS